MSTGAQWIAVAVMVGTFALCILFYRRGYQHGYEVGKLDERVERIREEVQTPLRGGSRFTLNERSNKNPRP